MHREQRESIFHAAPCQTVERVAKTTRLYSFEYFISIIDNLSGILNLKYKI